MSKVLVKLKKLTTSRKNRKRNLNAVNLNVIEEFVKK